MIGTGPDSYQILLEYPLSEKDSSPLGLHRFNDVWAANLEASGGSGRVLVANDEPLRARLSEQGMMLVTEANADRVRGVVLGLVLQNAAGLATDYMPFGTFQIH